MKTIESNVAMLFHDIKMKEFKNLIMKEEKEYIEKQEILDAIREGLLEVKKRRESGNELMNAEDLLNEL